VKKLQSARDHLLAAPLGIQPDKLLTFAESGTVATHRGDGPDSFLVRYTAHLIVTDFTGQPVQLFWAVLGWMRTACPGAVPDALKFHVDVIDHKKADVSLKLDLEETVQVRTTDDGTWIVAQDDPDALVLDMGALTPGLA